MSQVRKPDNYGAVTKASGTSLSVAASRVIVGGQQLKTDSASTVDLTTTGAGGLDTGSLVLDTLYYVYAVNASDSLDFVASTALPATGPTGFNSWTEVGRFRTLVGAATVAAVSYKGEAIGPWVAYTPALSNDNNVDNNEAFHRRSGTDMEVVGFVDWDGAGGGTSFSVYLPSGYNVDYTSLVSDVGGTHIGTATFTDSGTSYDAFHIYAANAQYVRFLEIGTLNVWDGTAAASTDRLGYRFKVPIAEFVGLYD